MTAGSLTIMMCGDVMLGRGVDQILPHPSPPQLFEAYTRSALDYVALAERTNGPIQRPAPFSYVWGDALAELERRRPGLRIVNLETAITRADRPTPKGINYRMSPTNLPCLTAARIDCCVLANNHVLDWGHDRLIETLASLNRAGIKVAGAGLDLAQAQAPAIFHVGARRVLVYAGASPTSGIPNDWAAGPGRSGVAVIEEPSTEAARNLAHRITNDRRNEDVVIFSIHWGGNWGYHISATERAFAECLLGSGQVDLIHGHSSHHFKAIGFSNGKTVLFGCGDLLNDYEGIGGHEAFRSELVLMYFADLSVPGRTFVEAVPFRVCKLRLRRADRSETEWIASKLDTESRRYGGYAALTSDACIRVSAFHGG